MEDDVSRCPVDGDPIDMCQGHGRIGDPVGVSILSAHDEGHHGRCHPAGCDERRESFCVCPNPIWVSGMMYVDLLDAESVYNERRDQGQNGPRCQRCDRFYHPGVSYDPYA